MNQIHVSVRLTALLSFIISIAATVSGADKRVFVQFAPAGKAFATDAVTTMGGRVHHRFERPSAIAMTVPDYMVDSLARDPNVRMVEEDPQRFLFAQSVPYGIDMVQAPLAVAAGATGAGIRVGVIDSGVYAQHEDFLGVTMAGSPDFGLNDQRTWFRDFLGHGTHVTGTIAAANNSLGVVGVSPGAVSIYMVKVFGDTGQWIYSSDLLAAMLAAENNGAKIISMSLGGPTASVTEQTGITAMFNRGVLLVAAAGNAGTTSFSYPASYEPVISVAAIDATRTVASFSQRNAQVDLAAPGVGVVSTVPYRDVNSITVGGTVYAGDRMEFSASGQASAPLVNGGLATGTNSGWAGRIVLVQRGTNSFLQKVQNVQNSGGRAVVIYNNVPGGFSATLGQGNGTTIPAISLSLEAGQTLVATAIGQTASVTSELSMPASGYDSFDGTSMATPHVSGVAALIWSKHPTATNVQVRQALTQTAVDLGTAGRDNSYGFGLVQAKSALDRLAVIVGGGGGGDTTAPVISGVASARLNTRQGTFEIRWTTNEPATTVVIIGTTTFTGSPALVTSHRMTFTGTRGATYQYSVRSADAAGNTSTAGPFTHRN